MTMSDTPGMLEQPIVWVFLLMPMLKLTWQCYNGAQTTCGYYTPGLEPELW